MAYQVSWLPGAIDDLDAIAAYIAADSRAHAAAVVTRMLECAKELALFPFSHPCVAEWDDDAIRQQIVYSYRLIYCVRQPVESIEVLAVIHGARLWPMEIPERR